MGEAGARERAIAEGGLDRGRVRRGLEGGNGGRVMLLLQLALPQQHDGLAADRALGAAGRRAGQRGGILERVLGERGVGHLERDAAAQRMIGELLPQAGPRGVGVLLAAELGRDDARVVQALRGRALGGQRLVLLGQLTLLALAHERVGHVAPGRRGQLVLRVLLGEGAQLGRALVGLPARDERLAEGVARVR